MGYSVDLLKESDHANEKKRTDSLISPPQREELSCLPTWSVDLSFSWIDSGDTGDKSLCFCLKQTDDNANQKKNYDLYRIHTIAVEFTGFLDGSLRNGINALW